MMFVCTTLLPLRNAALYYFMAETGDEQSYKISFANSLQRLIQKIVKFLLVAQKTVCDG